MAKRTMWLFASLAVGLFLILSCIAFIYFSSEDKVFFGTNQITSGQNYSQDPAVCSFHGQIYVAYEMEEDTVNSIIVGTLSENSLTNLAKVSAKGDNANPCLLTWNERMYVFWDTSDSSSTDGKDSDIAMRTYNGANWGNITDVSSWTGEASEDTQPKAIVFSDEMHVIWQNETSILHRSIEASGKMSQVIEVGGGWGADIEVLGGSLYVAWTTYYDSGTGDTSVYLRRHADGAWQDEIISMNPNIGSLDYFPSMEVFQDKLYVAWVTKDKTISAGQGDDDIVVRHYDPAIGNIASESAWGPATELSAPIENWDDWPLLFSDSENLYVVWQTWNLATNNGDAGDDLVLREFKDGAWGGQIKITDSQEQDGDIYEMGFSAFSGDDGIKIFFQSRALKTSGTDWQLWLASSD